MKRFLKNVSILAGLALALHIVLTVSAGLLISHDRDMFVLEPGRNILVTGHSMTEGAIDDSILRRAANYSQSADHYMHSYLKIKKILEYNPQIDTILLSFSYFNFEKRQDRIILFKSKVQTYYPLFGPREIARTFYSPGWAGVRPAYDLAQALRGRRALERMGGYSHLKRDKLQTDIERRESLPGNGRPERELPEEKGNENQIYYLQKIVELCREKGVKLLLINTPIYHADTYYNPAVLEKERRLYCHGTPLLDYSNLPLPDSCYGDITHLNYKGAEAFSEYLSTHGFNGAEKEHTVANGQR